MSVRGSRLPWKRIQGPKTPCTRIVHTKWSVLHPGLLNTKVTIDRTAQIFIPIWNTHHWRLRGCESIPKRSCTSGYSARLLTLLSSAISKTQSTCYLQNSNLSAESNAINKTAFFGRGVMFFGEALALTSGDSNHWIRRAEKQYSNS